MAISKNDSDFQELLSNKKFVAMLSRVEADACKARFFEFVKSFWEVIIPEEPVYNWHIEYLCDELQKLAYYIVNRLPKPYDLIINIPPGTSKSTIVTIMFPAWLWTIDPTIRVISNSYSSGLSIEHATKSRDIIKSAKYKRLFPEVQLRDDKGAKSNYENTKGGARYTTSTGGTITGKHAHLILNDDPLNPKQAASDKERIEANNHSGQTLSSRKVNKKNTPTVLVMQRLHDEDPTGVALKKKASKIKHICLPAELSDAVNPPELSEKYIDGLLDPVRLDREVLDEAKIDLGSSGYSKQYGQKPTPDEGGIIKKVWLSRKISRTEFNSIKGNNPIIFFADTAYTADKTNDPTGIIATCKIGNYVYISKGEKWWLEFPDLIKKIKDFSISNGYSSTSTIRIEPKASGKSASQQIKRDTGMNVVDIDSLMVQESKIQRLTTVSAKIEAGFVILVDDNWNDEFIDEVCGFPAKPHDEYVDLISYAIDYHLNKKDVKNTIEILKMLR